VGKPQPKPRFPIRRLPLAGVLAVGLFCLLAASCHRTQPSIEFTVVPGAGAVDAQGLGVIEGKVTGATQALRVVLYARNGEWAIQPSAGQPFTVIGDDSHWKSETRSGTRYAALLVDAGYRPAPKLAELPAKGGQVLAVASVEGRTPASPQKTVSEATVSDGAPANHSTERAPSIEFTLVPPAETGTQQKLHQIAGRVRGAKPGQRIVLFARSGQWWVQPTPVRPFTDIQPDSQWKGATHPGTEYAALLVDPGYSPPATADELPAKGGYVSAAAIAKGADSSAAKSGLPRSVQPIHPSIEFTTIPPAGAGNANALVSIGGTVKGAAPGQRIVLYAKSVVWWVQPTVGRPFTEIEADSHWNSPIHPGSAYAALLVDSTYQPPAKVDELPSEGGLVRAVAITSGSTSEPPQNAPRVLQFSGYPWTIRENPGQSGAVIDYYDTANAWTDQQGLLHLRVKKQGDKWLCAEVTLTRSLGYGSYRFVVRDVSHLDPATVLILGPSGKMDIEISRWGQPESKNAQYVIKPTLIPANTFRFTAPAGTLTHWMNWEAGRLSFRTAAGASLQTERGSISEHVFTSGIPVPTTEKVSLILYTLGEGFNPRQNEFEVVIEKFEFLP
jgi:hypothetical protein